MEKSKQVVAIDPNDRQSRIFLFGEPDKCLLCNSTLYHTASAFLDGDTVYRISSCTATTCKKKNVLVYKYYPARHYHYRFVQQQISVPIPNKFPEVTGKVAKLSPQFVEVYAQALATEQLNLTQVTGLALRKSLEFLVKDYSIAHYPKDREAIQKKPLAQCIEDYINDHYLKETAKRATWLGNDETHYNRRWQDHDLEDLKILIRLTIGWLHNALLTDEYLKSMPETGHLEP
jgi:hypothetical protein